MKKESKMVRSLLRLPLLELLIQKQNGLFFVNSLLLELRFCYCFSYILYFRRNTEQRKKDKTSAAVVADTKNVKISVCPVDAFFAFVKTHPQCEVQFYENITKKLAQLLQNLHSRTLDLSSLNIRSGQLINNEAVIFSWPCSQKGKLGTSDGQLFLSRNYVAFVKEKNVEPKGVVSDASDAAKTVLNLKSLVENVHQNGKILLRDREGSKINISMKKNVNGSFVTHVISTAKKTVTNENPSKPSYSSAGKLARCLKCKEFFCSYCQCRPNPCANGTHEFSDNPASSSSPCASCGNSGTHLLAAADLKILLQRFPTTVFQKAQIIQQMGTSKPRIGYVLEGTVAVCVITDTGSEVQLNDIVGGETLGDIGAFMKTPASANLTAGEKGCLLLEIPTSFLFGQSDNDFRVRVYYSLIHLMWNRILRQEAAQVKLWVSKFTNSSANFLSESLLRESTGKKIDERGQQGWY